jgi:hypothetical protein
MELVLCFSALQPIKSHIHCFILLFITHPAIKLSVWIGVSGCKCSISLIIFLIYTASFAMMTSSPSLASETDDMMALIIWTMLRMAPLLGGNCSSDKR